MGDKGSSEQRVWTKKADMDFIDIVFRWSLEDIFNENLYKDQVKKIPVSFQSVDQYFESYVLPLLDEIRVEMQSSMETIARAPYAEVTNLDVASCVPFSFAVNVDYWRKRSSTPDKKPYKTLPGDVLVIADVKPETASDLVSSGTAWTFALVTKIKDGNGNNSSSTSFKLTTLKDFRSKDDKKKSLYVIHLMSLITNRRLWNALHMRRNLKIINEVLCTDQKVAKGCCLCSSEIGGDWNNIFLKILLSQLNDSQKNSVVACLNKMQCNHKSHVELIWGPPGTGKTRTVSVLLFSLLRMKYRTLTCAPTNVAIADLAARVVKLVKESIKTGSVADGQFCSLGDILLFGNKQRLKVDFKIEEIFLDYRVDRLSECFGLLVRNQCLSILKALFDSLSGLKLPSSRNKKTIEKFCFESASLFFSTAISSFKLYNAKMQPLKVLVIDEAAQLKECESAIPLQLPGLQHSVLIGDECQLPATVKSKVCDEAGFGRSLFQRLTILGHSKHLLNTQYRMHPSISHFPNACFYNNKILDAAVVKRQSYEKHYLPWPMFGPYSFLNVSGREEADGVGHSLRNMIEVAVVQKLVQTLFNAWKSSRTRVSIGIISPYTGQVVSIQQKLGKEYEKVDGFSVKVKHCLWIVGDGRTLSERESVWQGLIHYSSCFFNADEDKELAQAILHAKKDFGHPDDLLNQDSAISKNARHKPQVPSGGSFKKQFGNVKSAQTQEAVKNHGASSRQALEFLDELSLEEDSGNFSEAAIIAKLGGDQVHFWELVEALNAADDIKEQRTIILLYASTLRVYLEECLQKKPAGGEDVVNMLNLMKQLHGQLEPSKLELESSIPVISALCKELHSGWSSKAPFLHQQFYLEKDEINVPKESGDHWALNRIAVVGIFMAGAFSILWLAA
ncbi:hypothetical protein V6N12_006075 [Hibiscus sabdariffa]|uniref:Helicase MAGATAMA 3 n=1 Tax=Hibiscus sabdariffa TaxID=183260 RepID=A0ABR2EXZ9_9ROSI